MYKVLTKNEAMPVQNHNFLATKGISVVWRGGDVIRPLNGNWLEEPYPTKIVKFFCKWRVLPLIRWRFGKAPHETVGYVGFKAFGVDLEAYKHWLPEDKVVDGSVALTLSLRFDADDH